MCNDRYKFAALSSHHGWSPAQGKKLMTLKHGLGNATAGDPVREPPRAPDHWEHAVTVNGLV